MTPLTEPPTPFLIAGPCVIESLDSALRHAERLRDLAARVGMPLVFKSSYDKANRTSLDSFRGPGLDSGLRILETVRNQIGVRVLTDCHSPAEMAAAGQVVDVVQVPAFLCRQTDLLAAAAQTGRTVNVKKGQFLAPDDMAAVVDKLTASGAREVWLTERGTTFGYHRLVVDFAGIVRLKDLGLPVIFDATHSVQLPGALGNRTGGERRFAPYLAWAAAAVGVDGLFVEVHENPDRAPSDGPNMLPLDQLPGVLDRFLRIHRARTAEL